MTKELINFFRTAGKPLLVIVAGSMCICLAAFIGSRSDLLERLSLDLFGQSVQGQCDFRHENGLYRLRFVDEDGAIYARLFSGWLGPQGFRRDKTRIILRYNKSNPRLFQPAGVSVLPAIASFPLFLVGFYLIIVGRRRVLATLRQRSVSTKEMSRGTES